MIHGVAPANAGVEIGVGDRVLTAGKAGPDGRFDIGVTLPGHAKRLWARLQDAHKWESVQVETGIPWEFAFEPAWALWLEDIGGLWIMGETLPFEEFAIRPAGDSADLAVAAADGDGVLDALIRISGKAPPGEVFLTARERSQAFRPTPMRVVAARLDSLSVSRTLRITLPPRAALDSLAANMQKSDASERKAARQAYPLLLKAISAEVEFEVRLPAGHPYLSAYSSGLITPETFFERSLGRFGGEAAPLFLSPSDTRAGSRSPGAEAADYVDLEAATALLRSDSGSAAVKGKLAMMVGADLSLTGIREGSPSLSLGSLPFLSPRDSLIVNLNGRKLGWLSHSLPAFSDETRAVWIGRHGWGDTASDGAQSFALGFKDLEGFDALKEKLERLRSSGKAEGAVSRREFIATFEERNSGGLAERFWRTLLELIPFLWAFWLISRRLEKANPLWRPMLAMGLFYAVWTCRDLLWFLEVGCHRMQFWGRFFRGLGHRSSLPANDSLWSSGLLSGEVFWLFFLLLIGFAPFYFKGLAGETAARKGPVRKRRPLRMLAFQVLLFAIGLGLAAWLFAESARLGGATGHTRPGFLSDSLRRLLFTVPADPKYLALGECALALMGFAAFGSRGLLFGLGQAAFLLYVLLPRVRFAPLAALGQRESFAWAIVVLSGLAAFPLIRMLLRRTLPFPSTRSLSLMSAGMIAAFLAFPYLPARTLMQAASFLLFTGLAWTVLHGLPTPSLTVAWKTAHPRTFPVIVVLALAAAIAVGWPMSESGTVLRLSHVGPLVEKLQALLPYLFGLGFLLRIPPESRPGSIALRDEDLKTGAFIFAALLIGPTTTSLWLPIPFMVALMLARHRLFRPAGEVAESGESDLDNAPAMGAYLKKAMAGAFARTKLRSALDSLDEKLLKAEITPEEHSEKRAGLQTHFEARAQQGLPGIEDVSKPNPGPPWLFSVAGPDIRRNVSECLRVGAWLSLAPILIGIYQNLPEQRADSLFPLADCAIYLASGLLYWLVLVCFFGIFFPYLRGHTGLTKGFQFAFLLVLPHLVLRVLEAQDLADMRPLILWSMQIMAFMSLLGLLAGDWRLLKSNGLRARNLLLVHNLPFLSAYASIIMAAAVSGVAGLVQGRLKNLFGFFLDKIIRN